MNKSLKGSALHITYKCSNAILNICNENRNCSVNFTYLTFFPSKNVDKEDIAQF